MTWYGETCRDALELVSYTNSMILFWPYRYYRCLILTHQITYSYQPPHRYITLILVLIWFGLAIQRHKFNVDLNVWPTVTPNVDWFCLQKKSFKWQRFYELFPIHWNVNGEDLKWWTLPIWIKKNVTGTSNLDSNCNSLKNVSRNVSWKWLTSQTLNKHSVCDFRTAKWSSNRK